MLTSSQAMAHDLRMPLQLIESGAQMLQLALDDPTVDARGYLQAIRESVRQMRDMLDAALDGPTPARTEVCDMPRRVRELCRRCQPYARERGVRLSCSGNVASLRMAADGDALSRVVLNLIMNALRATPAGGWVRVSWRAMGDWAEIRVRDDGPGIPAERQPYVFLRGETEGGRGLGLPIAEALARRMGGALQLRSEAGGGSEFTLRLPVSGALRAAR